MLHYPCRGRRASLRCWSLHGQRRRNGRLWRRQARAPEAVAGRPLGRSLPWEHRASQPELSGAP
eukprot:scaffold54672_cov62-Phaeocystis_antarctica.AAC.2